MVVAQLVEQLPPTLEVAVQIQSSANFMLNIVYCQLYWRDENKEKRGREWPIFILLGRIKKINFY